MKQNYDRSVVVSGDGDFHCLIEHLIKIGKFERLLVPDRYKYSSLLRKFSANIAFISDLRVKLGKA